ncbi:methyl-accepting chemotaxis protein TlpA [Clostridium aceticum]|uniref:Methyl-accepting chemotaxis protein TlpA n=1 Tax=Clostridium aceticum TaxID=84022 RepID=A0A0G3WB13_9CLOT|nr:methyl-accepting chemotaxis protein [Clostridium aceticum]AKL95856.1 methyl-accepting chemotaxis protein TlpA [Clostridium aceticum]
MIIRKNLLNRQSGIVKQALKISKEMASISEEILRVTALEQGGNEKLYEVFKEKLEDVEYITVLNMEGTSLVHTNPFREGIVFSDDVARKGIQSTQPIVQIYHRDTGEVVIDAASPIKINGERLYTLRVGMIKVENHLMAKNFTTTLIPIFLAMLVIYTGGMSKASFWMGGAIGIVTAFIATYYFVKSQEKVMHAVQKGMKKVVNGDLTLQEKNQRRDAVGQLLFETNKLSKGLNTLVEKLLDIGSQVTKSSSEQEIATDEVQRGTESIAASIEEVSAGAQQQVAAMEEVSEFIQRVSNNMQQLAESMKAAIVSGEEGMLKGQKGNNSIVSSIQQMEAIQTSFEVSAQVLRDLEEKSQKIGNIIHAITSIAEQTNLLALNAAIEAARAGEHGRGFAVVAEEVRKLAEDSSHSAQEIMKIISETQEKTKEAVSTMEVGSQEVKKGSIVIRETGESIGEIIDALEGITEQMKQNGQLTLALKEASSELEEKTIAVNEATQNTSEAMQDIAATIEEQSAMSEEIAHNANLLAEASKSLQGILKRFRIK